MLLYLYLYLCLSIYHLILSSFLSRSFEHLLNAMPNLVISIVTMFILAAKPQINN